MGEPLFKELRNVRRALEAEGKSGKAKS
jgi:hypothetical protein